VPLQAAAERQHAVHGAPGTPGVRPAHCSCGPRSRPRGERPLRRRAGWRQEPHAHVRRREQLGAVVVRVRRQRGGEGSVLCGAPAAGPLPPPRCRRETGGRWRWRGRRCPPPRRLRGLPRQRAGAPPRAAAAAPPVAGPAQGLLRARGGGPPHGPGSTNAPSRRSSADRHATTRAQGQRAAAAAAAAPPPLGGPRPGPAGRGRGRRPPGAPVRGVPRGVLTAATAAAARKHDAGGAAGGVARGVPGAARAAAGAP